MTEKPTTKFGSLRFGTRCKNVFIVCNRLRHNISVIMIRARLRNSSSVPVYNHKSAYNATNNNNKK